MLGNKNAIANFVHVDDVVMQWCYLQINLVHIIKLLLFQMIANLVT